MERVFKDSVLAVVKQIPAGKVMTYGQIAAICGSPGAARVVGQIAHFGQSDLPWHRVVNAKGGMASGFVPGGPAMQAKILQSEGLELTDGSVLLKEALWWPDKKIAV